MSGSLSRAFTTRRTAKPSIDNGVPPMPKRSLTTKHSDTIRQQKISHPVELLSTTNMLSYSAPDIAPRSRSSSNSSAGSMTSGSSASEGGSSITTPITSPEVSSSESSPIAKMPDLNNLSAYFPTSPANDNHIEVPRIPQRAPSHTKKHSEVVARKRSMSRMATPKSSISSRNLSVSTTGFQSPAASATPTTATPGRASAHKSTASHKSNLSYKSSMSHKSSISTRSSVNMFSPNPETPEHPFGSELAQVSELAEEFGSSKQTRPILDPEEQELVSLGLFKFAADDYMNELQGLFITAFGEIPRQSSALWI